jgi:hypothetical protein
MTKELELRLLWAKETERRAAIPCGQDERHRRAVNRGRRVSGSVVPD